MKKKELIKMLGLVGFMLCLGRVGEAQLSMNAQLRTRSEFRSGQGTLPVRGSSPAFFTNQRFRLGVGYTLDRCRFYAAVQDIRIWGQDASTVSNADGNKLFLHEAWGEITLSDSTWKKWADNLSLKVGRQEIVYDDARLLGNLDWLQQARRHDAAILKWNKMYWFLDLGVALNQSREYKSSSFYDGTVGVPVNGTNGLTPNYKSFQYAYLRRNLGWGNGSLLFFKDDFAKTTGVYSVYSRMTTGFNLSGKALRMIDFNVFGYYQGNNDNRGNRLDAYSWGASAMVLATRKLQLGPGIDVLSGNNTTKSVYATDGNTVNRAFDPLYGTPHKFWGYMDYFYVADGYGVYGPTAAGLGNSSSRPNSPGLMNAFIKFKYKLIEKVNLSLDVHEFWAQNKVANMSTPTDSFDVLNGRLGTEIDLLVNYNMTPMVGFELGYSSMFGTPTLDALKHSGLTATAPNTNATSQRDIGHWVYLMVNIRPDLMADLNVFKRDSGNRLSDLNRRIEELERKGEETLEQK